MQLRAHFLRSYSGKMEEHGRNNYTGQKHLQKPPRLNTPVRIGAGPSVSPTRTGRQEIGSPSGSIGPVEVRNAHPLHTCIDGISAKHSDPAPTFSKLIG